MGTATIGAAWLRPAVAVAVAVAPRAHLATGGPLAQANHVAKALAVHALSGREVVGLDGVRDATEFDAGRNLAQVRPEQEDHAGLGNVVTLSVAEGVVGDETSHRNDARRGEEALAHRGVVEPNWNTSDLGDVSVVPERQGHFHRRAVDPLEPLKADGSVRCLGTEQHNTVLR